MERGRTEWRQGEQMSVLKDHRRLPERALHFNYPHHSYPAMTLRGS